MDSRATVDPALAPTGANVETVDRGQAADKKGAGMARPPQAGFNSVQTRLQDVLPQIQELANRVGGMDKLAEIVATLQQTKG
jgi:hypothetical protein